MTFQTMFPTRRSLFKIGGVATTAGAASAALSSCGPSARPGGNSNGEGAVRVAWYGGQPVHEGVEDALSFYRESNGDTEITTEKSAFGDYWDKLATQFAAQDGPDVMRMSMTWLSEYAERGTLLPLDDLVDGPIDISDLDDDVAASGTVDDTRYGVGQSSITQACFRNPFLAQEVGATMPDTWSWEDFMAFCTDFAKEAGEGKYGSTDVGGDLVMFEVWARAHGTDLFDGQDLAFDSDLLEEWLEMWESLRQGGGVPPADITAEGGSFEDSPFAQYFTAVTFGWVQQLTFYQPVMEESPLDVIDVPGMAAGDISGQFLQALDFWSIATNSKNADEAAALIDFLINDTDAVNSIGTSLGVPPAQASRDILSPDSDSADGKAMAYVESVSGKTGPRPEPWPRGYGPIQSDLFNKLNQDVGFGQVTVAEGVETFMKDAQSALDG